MNAEATLAAVYEAHAAELTRIKADYTRELNAKLEQINKQAETIREKELTATMWHDKAADANNKLLSALAAIEEARIVIELGVEIMTVEQVGKWAGVRSWQEQEIDLSLLHEHDAELRKPLVDALEIAESYIKENGVKEMIADALAKVKESK